MRHEGLLSVCVPGRKRIVQHGRGWDRGRCRDAYLNVRNVVGSVHFIRGSMKVPASRWVYVLLFSTVFGWAQEQTTKVKPATVEGMVTKVGTGEPVPEVRVTATPETGSTTGAAAKNASTDEKGHFIIEGLQPGTYSVTATRTLFVRARRNTAALTLNLAADQHIR